MTFIEGFIFGFGFWFAAGVIWVGYRVAIWLINEF